MLVPANGKDHDKSLLRRSRQLGAWPLLVDLYQRNAAFRGFFEFSLIGAVVLAFLSPVSLSDSRHWLGQKLLSAWFQTSLGDWRASPLTAEAPRVRFPLPQQITIDKSLFASASGEDRQRLTDAADLHRSRQHAAALRILEPTNADDPNAQLMRGLLLIAQTSPSNIREGVALLERAAVTGQRQAMTYLAVAKLSALPEVMRDPEGALRWLERASEAGEIDATRFLGDGYLGGMFGVADPARSARYYRAASERGDNEAAFHLATALFSGNGIPKNESEAEVHIRRAAEGGHAKAQHALGQWLLTRYALGWSDDPTEGVAWLERAVSAGELPAMYWLGVFHVEVARTAPWRDFAKGIALFQKCAGLWYEDCIYAYAVALENGVGIAHDASRAWAYYKVAHEASEGKGKAGARIAAIEAAFTPTAREDAERILAGLARNKPPFALSRIGRDFTLVPKGRGKEIDTSVILQRYRDELAGIEISNPGLVDRRFRDVSPR
jgi:TPR repeat protein